MSELSRRDFIRWGSLGLAAASLGELALPAGAEPTESSGSLGPYGRYRQATTDPPVHPNPPAQAAPPPPSAQTAAWAPTEDNILGPFYRPGAPYRAKVTPPLAQGLVTLISGRVWGFDTRRPLPYASIDVWQADMHGRYDNDDPQHPPAPTVFRNRASLIADASGYYEFETIHPGRYKIDVDTWRPSHIHFWVRYRGYRQLVTQLYFAGDPYNDRDQYIKKSLIREMKPIRVEDQSYQAGEFHIVLAPA